MRVPAEPGTMSLTPTLDEHKRKVSELQQPFVVAAHSKSAPVGDGLGPSVDVEEWTPPTLFAVAPAEASRTSVYVPYFA